MANVIRATRIAIAFQSFICHILPYFQDLAKEKAMSPKGKVLRFPQNRQLILDICQAAKSVPAFPVERKFYLKELQAARDRSKVRISWVALFLKAHGLTSQLVPELRQVYVKYPWVRLYEHPNSVASISVEREGLHGERRLIWARIPASEDKSLVQIQEALHHAQTGDLKEVFKDGIRMEKVPRPLRRLSWWLGMNWHGRQKAKKIGTFGISTLSGVDTLNRGHPLVVTTSLSYSRCDVDGGCLVTMLTDHRVMDGMLAASVLHQMEKILNSQVLEELINLST
jgi:hypothetical protein